MLVKTSEDQVTGLLISRDPVEINDIMGRYSGAFPGDPVFVHIYELDRAPLSGELPVASQPVDEDARFVFSLSAPLSLGKCYIGVGTNNEESDFVADATGMYLHVAYKSTPSNALTETLVGNDEDDVNELEVFTSEQTLLRCRMSKSASADRWLQVHAKAAADLSNGDIPLTEMNVSGTITGFKDFSFGAAGLTLSACTIGISSTAGSYTAAAAGTTTISATYR